MVYKEIIEQIKDIKQNLEYQLAWHHQHHSGQRLWSVEHQIAAIKEVIKILETNKG